MLIYLPFAFIVFFNAAMISNRGNKAVWMHNTLSLFMKTMNKLEKDTIIL